MVQCSKHVIPPAITANLTNQPAHDLVIGLNTQRRKVLTGWRLGTSLLDIVEPTRQTPLASVQHEQTTARSSTRSPSASST
jgi:hypothetical protein